MIIEARSDVVRLEGALDKNLWPTIEAAANLLLRSHSSGIIVDGSGLTGCSPEGAKTFRDAQDYIERHKARIVVAGLPESVMDVVRATPGIRSRLPMAASVDDARASLQLHRPGPPEPADAATGGILVPLLRADSPEAATALACRLAKAVTPKARLHLLYVLDVPRNLPLNAPLPDEEAAAARVLDAAEAVARREGVGAARHVARTREAGEEIVHQATELGVARIVLAYAPSADPSDDLMTRISRFVFDRAPCEVILNKIADKNSV